MIIVHVELFSRFDWNEDNSIVSPNAMILVWNSDMNAHFCSGNVFFLVNMFFLCVSCRVMRMFWWVTQSLAFCCFRDLVDEAKNYLLLPQERPLMQGPRTRPRKPIRCGEVLFAGQYLRYIRYIFSFISYCFTKKKLSHLSLGPCCPES